ncbi:MAG TPA: M48 family metalloprotease [Opitutaceae bacterium]|nr:M48 family metalloprotease [Opitutaceae bacterium]
MRFASLWMPFALGLLTGCQSTDVAPATRAGQPLEADERSLWERVQQEQDALDRSGFVAAWPDAEAYLNAVVARLHPGPLVGGAQVHVKILVDPTLNAFTLPNGALYIHTGMLARIENEAQLATVLGHELSHATNRHGLKQYRNIKNQSAFLASLTVGTSGIGTLLGGLGVIASVSGYSRELEREADVSGFQMLLAAGYDPRESPKVFRVLLDESQRSKIKEPFFFGSHPRLTERIASFEQLIAALPAARRAGRTDAEAYAAILPRVLVANAEAALRAGDYEAACTCAEHALALGPDDAGAALQFAEVFRKRGAEGDAVKALHLFRELTGRHPDLPEAQRGLGLVLFKSGDRSAAAAAFRRYLALRPAADDRAYIESFLQRCDQNS